MIMKKISAALMINILASAMHSYFEDNDIISVIKYQS